MKHTHVTRNNLISTTAQRPTQGPPGSPRTSGIHLAAQTDERTDHLSSRHGAANKLRDARPV